MKIQPIKRINTVFEANGTWSVHGSSPWAWSHRVIIPFGLGWLPSSPVLKEGGFWWPPASRLLKEGVYGFVHPLRAALRLHASPSRGEGEGSGGVCFALVSRVRGNDGGWGE